MLGYFFRSFDFGFSAPRVCRGDFWEEFSNTGTSFFELRVLIRALFFVTFFSTFVLVDFLIFFFCLFKSYYYSSTFEQFSSKFLAEVKSELLALFMKSSIVIIFMTRLHWNFQKVFFKRRRKNGSLEVLSKCYVRNVTFLFFKDFLLLCKDQKDPL